MMIRMRTLLVGVLSVVVGHASVSSAEPMTVRHGSGIHVSIRGRTEEAMALRPVAGGWRLDLAGVARTATVTIRDVTAGVAPAKFELSLVAGGALLDKERFRPDHAYRVELHKGESVVGSALIYLRPARQEGRVSFDAREASAPDADGDLSTFDKGAL
jgi:hypothetical protein